MAKYSKKAQDKVEEVKHEKKEGTLKSGRSGKKVTSRKQAIAIALSEARKAGAKVPKKAAPKKAATKKAAAPKSATKKDATKKSAAKKKSSSS
jgi:topoisomerase IA-like protein